MATAHISIYRHYNWMLHSKIVNTFDGMYNFWTFNLICSHLTLKGTSRDLLSQWRYSCFFENGCYSMVFIKGRQWPYIQASWFQSRLSHSTSLWSILSLYPPSELRSTTWITPWWVPRKFYKHLSPEHVKASWNVMVHAHETRFRLSAKRTSPFKSAKA